MSHMKQWQSTDTTTNINQALATEARLSRLHRLFKTHFNVTEPSLIFEPFLFLGNCISAHDTNRLSKLGIRYILNVAIRDVELCPYYSNDIRTLAIDLRDDDRENILRTFDQAFAFIDEAKRNKARVLVHCSHGQSRSPAIVIAYLMRTYNASLEYCLSHVIKARPCVLPNDGFLKQLILYDRFLVERRRQRQEQALLEVLNAAKPTEIAIQREDSSTPQARKPTNHVTLPSNINSDNETSNSTNISSIDSSSLGETSASSLQSSTSSMKTSESSMQTSPSSVQSSTSADSVHVIPIQVTSKHSREPKVKQVLIKKLPIQGESTIIEIKQNTKQLEEKFTVNDRKIKSGLAKLDVRTSNHAVPTKAARNGYITNIVKRSPSPVSWSHSHHANGTKAEHYDYVTYSSAGQKWNVITYYPENDRKHHEQPRTKYITEIYDKATNRFIPTTC